MLLALDTSTRALGVALYDGVSVRAELVWQSPHYHTRELTPAIRLLLSQTETPLTAVSALAVATGPGSFTGLRIGLAVAKGLAFSRGLPLIGVPTLDVVAATQPPDERPLLAVLQAGRGRLAVGRYLARQGRWVAEGAPQVLTIEALARRIRQPVRVAGELTAEQRARLARKWKNVRLATPAQSVRRPALLAELAWERWQRGEVDDPISLAPIYLHHGTPIPG